MLEINEDIIQVSFIITATYVYHFSNAVHCQLTFQLDK